LLPLKWSLSLVQSFPDGCRLTAGENGSEQRIQIQNGGWAANLLFLGPSKESELLSKSSIEVLVKSVVGGRFCPSREAC
jgi:hypothetical protein